MEILVVEDDDDCREILAGVLRRKFGKVAVSTAVNGKDGIDKFAEKRPEVVVTDMNMPEMGGVQMVDQIRRISPQTQIVVLTADTGRSLDDAPACDHYVLKPVNYRDLFTAIEQCLAKASPAAG
jgi:CheY-like chemotaxis protein